MQKTFMFIMLIGLLSLAHSETKIEIYKVRLGSFMKLKSKKDMLEFSKELEGKTPTAQYIKKSNDKMLNYGDIKVFLKNTKNKKDNYNKMLKIISDFSKEIKDIDHAVVAKTLNRLKVQ